MALISQTSYTLGRPKFAIASLSLGSNAYHNLPTKIRVASKLGYDGIEIFIPDFEAFVAEVRDGQHAELFDSLFPDTLPLDELETACAEALLKLCISHNLEIPLLQPLRNFENFRSQAQLDVALDEAERWFRLMAIMKCELILVCSNHIPLPHPITREYTREMYLDAQVDALRQLGARAEKYEVKIGYEPLSWGTVVDNWMQIWDVVKRVDRKNVGVLLDSFNTLGNQYADPGEASCIRPQQTLAKMLQNLTEMSRVIPAEKIFFYQIADGVRPQEILTDTEDMPRRMKWSRTSRVFPCEPPASRLDSVSDQENPSTGYLGFLPVTQMSYLVHRTGYRGWWSLEVYNSSLHVSDEECPWSHARRGIAGLKTLWEITKDEITRDEIKATANCKQDDLEETDQKRHTYNSTGNAKKDGTWK
ncbi:xylose isomerase-like protein [Rhodocollybia butyracea]|uniref:Xylose isomerase-like protein n=1 Tax=Rhodocollybia butyracea TaxID=206335 RepID=A0A9P5PHE1_9AGAR|nr:xylose isomerase-like protein [Rhodocollybia butyracea]